DATDDRLQAAIAVPADRLQHGGQARAIEALVILERDLVEQLDGYLDLSNAIDEFNPVDVTRRSYARQLWNSPDCVAAIIHSPKFPTAGTGRPCLKCLDQPVI